MLSLIKTVLYAFGLYNSSNTTYDLINNTYYPYHTDYIAYTEENNIEYNFNNYEIFYENIEYINKLNSENLSYNVEINQFIDKNFSKMNFIVKDDCHNCYTGDTDTILSIDWRDHDAVTEVKNQVIVVHVGLFHQQVRLRVLMRLLIKNCIMLQSNN